MKSFYDEVFSLIFNKNKKWDIDDIEEFSISPYVLLTYISYYDNNIATFVNEYCNSKIDVFSDNKQRQYEFLYNVLPQLKYKKINYYKKDKAKNKDNKTYDEQTLDVYSKRLQISKREIKHLLDKGLLDNLKEGIKNK